MEDKLGTTCGNLSAYVEAVREDLRRAKAKGLKGIKFHLAYMRDLYFAPQTPADAERVFLRVLEEGYGWRPVSLGYESSSWDVPVRFGVTQNVLPVRQISRNVDYAATLSAIDDVKGRRRHQYAEWLVCRP